MVVTRKLTVKKLPNKVCVSISAGKGRVLTKKSKVRYGKKRRGKSARRKTKRRTSKRTGGSAAQCVKRSNRSKIVCTRLARAGCLTKRGTLKKKKMCRTMARNRGLKSKTARRRRRRMPRGVLSAGPFKAWGDLLAP